MRGGAVRCRVAPHGAAPGVNELYLYKDCRCILACSVHASEMLDDDVMMLQRLQ